MASRTKLNQICQFCRRSPRTELKKCHKCGSVSYCSYACQREDLTNHQRACRVAREGVLIPPLDFLKTKKEKERLTEILTALCNDLSRWMEAKSSALLERCINELGLKYTPDACETHVLRVVVSRDEMWPSSTSTPGELFTVTKFEVMSVRYARESMILWKDCMRELEIQRQEAKANGLGMIAVVGVECPALATRSWRLFATIMGQRRLWLVPSAMHTPIGRRLYTEDIISTPQAPMTVYGHPDVPHDLSNYWFPTLYFRDPRTHQYEVVPNGGLLVYYQNRGKGDVANGGSGLKAFPPGFKMISGDPTRRAKKYTEGLGTQAELAERAISYTCLRYTTTNEDVYSYGFPSTDCEAGFQGRIHMPSCWDGQNLDSPDHRSHVAFLSDLDNGECPQSHSVYLMKLFYEVTWDVHHFSSRWAESDGWPFVYSTGDPTGYSWHGDFQNGWDVDILQGAIDHCNNPNDDTANGVVSACPLFTIIDAATADQCDLPSSLRANVVSNSTKLPGCNPLQAGPMDATAYTDDDCPNGASDSDAKPAAQGHGGKCRLTKKRFQW
ncbi:hypothetical protein EYR36_011865 [Pleurotus pulmonarius]|nr:hypothetical protein EYR36_011865 [Pleurotus pulmonarius]